MNGHGLVDDAEAAALLCELRASPVVHTSALYNTPQPQLRQQDLRLPSPHEILAQADWHRFSSSSERLTTEHARPTPPAFSPAPTHAFLYPDSHVPLPPLAKRKREPELDVSVRRPRHEPDQHHEVSGGRRGYLSMSALGVSDKPPERPRDFASPVPPTPRDERRYSALGAHERDVAGRELAPSSTHGYPPSSSRDYPLTPSRDHHPSSLPEYPPSSSRDYPPSSSRDHPHPARDVPPPQTQPRRPRITAPAPDNVYKFPQPAMSPYGLGLDDRERVSTPTSTLVPIPAPGYVRARSSTVAASNRPIQTSPPPGAVLSSNRLHPLSPVQPPVGKFRAPPFAGVQRVRAVSSAVPGGLRHEPIEIEDSPEPEERPPLAARREKAKGRGREEPPRMVREEPGSRIMREASSSRAVRHDLVPKVEPVSRRPGWEDVLAPAPEDTMRATARDERVSTPVKERDAGLSREQVPRPAMSSRFTDSTVHPYRPAKIETRGALGLEVAPGPPSARGFDAMPITPSSRTFDAVGRTFDGAKALDGPVRSFDGPRMETFSSTLTSGMRHDPSQLDHPITPTTRYDPTRFDAVSPVTSRYDATRRDAPTPPGLARYDTSPVVSRFNTSPAPRFDSDPTRGPYTSRPVARSDASPTVSRYDPTRIRAPEPYTDTETDKDADAPSSPLSEDETADEADRMDVEVVRGKVAETSSHPFPFSRPPASHGSNSRAGPSPPLHRSGPSPTLNRSGPSPVSSRSDPSPTSSRIEPPTPTNRADARFLHGDMEIYPANSPPVPKTVFGSASGEGSGHGRKRVSTSPVMRTKRLPVSPVVQTKPLSSPIAATRPLPTPINAPAPPVLPAGPVSNIRCVCRSTQDDRGQTIVCDGCSQRQHARCYGLDGIDGGDGLRWMCGLCDDGKGGWRMVHQEETIPTVEEPMKEMVPLDDGKESAGKAEDSVMMEQKEEERDGGKDAASVSVEVEMEVTAPEVEKEKEPEQVKVSEPEKEVEKEKVAPAKPKPVALKKKDLPAKPRVPGSKPGLGGFKTNAKSAKSGTSAIIPPSAKSLTPIVRTVAVPTKPTKPSGPPSSKPGPSRPSSSSKPASSSSASAKLKPIKTGSRASSMNGSPVIRARPLSPEPTPSAPLSPRSQSPVAREPEERAKPVEKAPKVIEKAPTPPPSNPSPVAARTALPASSPPRPLTPPVPSPPKPSTPSPDPGDDDIDAALWATEYDHIGANIVDASLRERLRNFGRERLAQRAEVTGEKPTVPPLTPFTSAEPVFLTSSQPTSLVRVKEIKPPPNQHTPTYGVLATSPISKGALVLEYRCALSDAHAYMSNKAHQYALLGTGTKYVRLVPAPLDICLDARVMGNEGRFFRCGCWPNAVVRPFIPVEGAIEDDDEDEAEARFGVFALRDLELGEEIVLGWEWSVEHVVHKLVRDPQLEPLPEDEDVLNDPDTKRLWDILDLLRSLSLTCACKPDSSTCALSFGRMLLEDADSVGHANDLGPLVGYKRYENGFEPTMHAVSTKTRRGRKAAKALKARPTAPPARAPSPTRPAPTQLPTLDTKADPNPEPKPELEPEPVPVPKQEPKADSPPPRDPTAAPRDPTPPPQPVTTPAKRAIGKLSIASSPLSELSDVDNEHNDDLSPDHAPKRHRGSNSTRTKHKRRIQSPTPEDEPEPLKSTDDEVSGVGTQAVEEGVPVSEAEASLNEPQQLQLTTVVASVVEANTDQGITEPEVPPEQTQAPEAANLEATQGPHESAASDLLPLDHSHDHDSDHASEAPKKVSFLDWARRRKSQVVDTKDDQSSEFNEVDASEPDLHRAGTETEIVTLSHGSPVPPATAALPPSSTSESMQTPLSATPDVVVHAPRVASTPPPVPTVPDGQAALVPDPSPEGTASPADVVMGDPPVPSINGKDAESCDEHLDVQPRSDTPEPPSVNSAPASSSDSHTQLVSDAMDVDAVAPTANIADMGQIRASPASFADGASYQPSASHTPPNPLSPLPVSQSNSSPGVLPALTKRLSSLGVEPLKLSNQQDPTQITPVPPRAPRSFGETPEEGEITPGARAQPALYTPGNGSPATTPNPLPSALPPSGPRDRQPPTQPRRFSADPPPNTSPSGSSGSRPPSAPYPRPPPAGPSRGVSLSPPGPHLRRGPENGNAIETETEIESESESGIEIEIGT
ncbi:hypothetical protein RhiLY_12756 [Ceratobasidium sp. AG-Ba]|nr:hypothetical protein RhiLY_12756 [Ceratobasidium sp. AG-Ba]